MYDGILSRAELQLELRRVAVELVRLRVEAETHRLFDSVQPNIGQPHLAVCNICCEQPAALRSPLAPTSNRSAKSAANTY